MSHFLETGILCFSSSFLLLIQIKTLSHFAAKFCSKNSDWNDPHHEMSVVLLQILLFIFRHHLQPVSQHNNYFQNGSEGQMKANKVQF